MTVIRKLFIYCLILLTFSVPGFAQESSQSENLSSEKAEKIDEFGPIGECDFGARLDSLMITLQEKAGATGYIILYQGKNVLPAQYESNFNERRIRNHLRFRNFDPSRLVLVNGGFRDEQATELWTVPSGAEPPTPTDTIPKPSIPTNKTYLYNRNHLSGSYEGDFSDEFILPSVKAQQEAEAMAAEAELEAEEINEEANAETETPTVEEETDEAEIATVEEETEIEQPTPGEIEEAKFYWANEAFGEMIKKRKNSSGVIIFYADDAYYDVGKLQSHIEDGKRRIAEVAKISPDKIQVIFGGYRTGIEAEFWIVPKKGEFPAPTPEERPVEEVENEIDSKVSQ